MPEESLREQKSPRAKQVIQWHRRNHMRPPLLLLIGPLGRPFALASPATPCYNIHQPHHRGNLMPDMALYFLLPDGHSQALLLRAHPHPWNGRETLANDEHALHGARLGPDACVPVFAL